MDMQASNIYTVPQQSRHDQDIAGAQQLADRIWDNFLIHSPAAADLETELSSYMRRNFAFPARTTTTRSGGTSSRS